MSVISFMPLRYSLLVTLPQMNDPNSDGFNPPFMTGIDCISPIHGGQMWDVRKMQGANFHHVYICTMRFLMPGSKLMGQFFQAQNNSKHSLSFCCL
jgi:hypothetical protein